MDAQDTESAGEANIRRLDLTSKLTDPIDRVSVEAHSHECSRSFPLCTVDWDLPPEEFL